jgi:hypothetical protein
MRVDCHAEKVCDLLTGKIPRRHGGYLSAGHWYAAAPVGTAYQREDRESHRLLNRKKILHNIKKRFYLYSNLLFPILDS